MAKLNRWQIMGNLGNDPEIRYTANGDQVMSFRVAVDGGYKKDGEWVENTLWTRVTLFGQSRIDYLQKLLQKGSLVYVEGRLNPGIYNGERGAQLSLDIFANDVQPLTRLIPKESDAQPRQPASAAPARGSSMFDDSGGVDDPPF